MKRGWIALIMIGIALVLSAIEYIYVTTNTKIYSQMLNEADEKMENNEIYDAEEIMKRLDYRFEKQSKVYYVFVMQGDIKNISSDLAMLRRYAQTGSTAEFLATSARVKREILAVQNTRIPRLENIF